MLQRPEENQEVELLIERFGVDGEGVGYWNGYTLFVEGALPGERVCAKVTERKKNYGRAERLSILEQSPMRVVPVCPLFETCGGCQIMHAAYSAQLDMKRQKVVDALTRIGKFDAISVSPCVASPLPLAYRNKIQMPIKNGINGLQIGFNRRHSHDVVDVEFCYIHCSLGQKVYETLRTLLLESGLDAYDWQTRKGVLRHLMIKSAVKTNQALVVFVTSQGGDERLKRIAETLIAQVPEVKGVLECINDVPDNVILRNNYTTLAGKAAIEEEIGGLFFAVSPSSFFQVNPLQAEQLYKTVIDYAGVNKESIVLDAFCGVGTLSLFLAREAKHVTGVECVASAIEDAKKNANRNKISNVSFVLGQAERYIQTIKQIDVAVLNPPRRGCESSLLDRLGILKPKRIVYVSCDPATLARDLLTLKTFGYTLKKALPFDMFPQTAHVETVVLMELCDTAETIQ